jgi:multifunctional beta-oxidation protein
VSVVVNDLGGTREGSGSSHKAADIIVDEIKAAGGQAVANYDSVTDGQKIVATAIQAFGRIDIVINNAGILRDKSLAKMTLQDWDLVQQVHLHGAFAVTKAAWPHFLKQGYGRIIMTCSAAGLYGNYGQTNYASAKLALYGLGRCLALEGEKKNVYCNIIAPMAGSRITETVLPPEVLTLLDPKYVAPSVAYLCHKDCKENGAVFEVGGGYIGRVAQQRCKGFSLDPETGISVDLLKKIDQLSAFKDVEYPDSIRQVDWVGLAQRNAALLKSKPLRKYNLDFKGQVALVTGAGGGLGRAYAVMLGNFGAHVIVNDMGKNSDGVMLADCVVDEIKKHGGSASPNYHNVLDADEMAKEILSKHEVLHILINNAGVLRDKSFLKMTSQEWFDVVNVHLNGTFRVTKAFLPVFLKQKYGRIINTTSAVGLYGNYGQANYSSAKAGIISFSKSLSQELSKHNVTVNCVAPNAGTSMTATVLPKDIVDLLKPEYVAPFVMALCYRESNVTGRVFEVGSGWIGEVRYERSKWVKVDCDDLKATFTRTKSHEGATYPQNALTSFIEIQQLASLKADIIDKNGSVIKVEPRDVILYHVGIGFGEKDLEYVYEGSSNFKVFPTFGVVPGFDGMMSVPMADYLNDFNPVRCVCFHLF